MAELSKGKDREPRFAKESDRKSDYPLFLTLHCNFSLNSSERIRKPNQGCQTEFLREICEIEVQVCEHCKSLVEISPVVRVSHQRGVALAMTTVL